MAGGGGNPPNPGGGTLKDVIIDGKPLIGGTCTGGIIGEVAKFAAGVYPGGGIFGMVESCNKITKSTKTKCVFLGNNHIKSLSYKQHATDNHITLPFYNNL